jgi:hypothetical protein
MRSLNGIDDCRGDIFGRSECWNVAFPCFAFYYFMNVQYGEREIARLLDLEVEGDGIYAEERIRMARGSTRLPYRSQNVAKKY